MPGADATDALDEAVAIANDGDAAQATSATTAASSTMGVASEPPTSSTNEASSVFTPRRSSFVEEREQPEAPNGPGADGTGDEPAIAGEGRVAVDDTTATVDIPPLAETGDSEEVPASSPAAPTLTELASTFESPTAELAPVTEPTETTSALVDSAAAPEAPPAADQPVAEVESEASEDESAPASTVVDTEYGSMREDDQPKTPTLTFDDVPVVPPLGRMGTAERSPTIDGSIPTVPGAGASAAAAAAVTETMAAVPSKSAPAATDPTPTPTAPAPSPAPTVPMRRRPRRARLKVTRLDPWTVMKIAFLLALAAGIMTLVAVAVLWMALDSAGVFHQVGETINSVTSGGQDEGFDLEGYLTLSRVLGFTGIVAALEVVVLTALATLLAFMYNVSSGMVGGVEVTLAEDD